jgi:predicted kinase
MLSVSNSLKLIVISGPPGAGKTTLGQRIADQLTIPFLSKDMYKEILFDKAPHTAWKSEQHLDDLRAASYEMLYATTEKLLKGGSSVIIESNFVATYDNPKIERLAQTYGAHLFELHCTAPTKIILQRINDRVNSGMRHAVHIDTDTIIAEGAEAYEKTYLSNKPFRLGIGQPTIDLDTSDFSTIDYYKIVASIA